MLPASPTPSRSTTAAMSNPRSVNACKNPALSKRSDLTSAIAAHDASRRAMVPLWAQPMPSQDPFIGREIVNGAFHVLQKIGSGGMGSVYKAHERETNRMVGVKILQPKLADRKDLVSRFRREARAMSQLSHPNIVRVFSYGELEDGSLSIIMEFLEGKNLNQ